MFSGRMVARSIVSTLASLCLRGIWCANCGECRISDAMPTYSARLEYGARTYSLSSNFAKTASHIPPIH